MWYFTSIVYMRFCKILLPSPWVRVGEGSGKEIQKHIFENNLAPNYDTIMKLHMGTLDMNTKKSFLPLLEFLILRGGMENTLNFKKFEFLNITRLFNAP